MGNCMNSMSGKHVLIEQVGKNKGKNVCRYCRCPMKSPFEPPKADK